MAFTFFFRDLDCLEFAIQTLLPQAAGRSRVRIWDAGCAMGHEPYTLAILLAENMGGFGFRNLEIHATDYDEPLLKTVKEGTYAYEELKRIPEQYFKKYFESLYDHTDHFRIIERLRATMHVQHHNLLTYSAVRDGFSLIVCKNVLLHFHYSERVEVIRMFHKALEPNGLFVTERTQKMPEEISMLFTQVDSNVPLYRKAEKSHVQ
jgi:chemotaxis protein methyltransferase CheR